MINKYKLVKTILFVVVLIFLISYIICDVNLNTNYEKKAIYQSSTNNTPIYIVKDFNGKIAVYEYNSNVPKSIYNDPYIKNLPVADRQALQKGIEVYSTSELSRLLEDFDN